MQAIEKYLKANLLYHGVRVRGYGHNILHMAKELEAHDTFLKDIKLAPRAEHQILVERNLWGSTDVNVFLKTIQKYGDADNRYDFYGSQYEFSHLFKLDHVIYALRSNVTKIHLLHNDRDADRLRNIAYEQNYYFAPVDYKHQSIDGFVGAGSSVPSTEAAIKGVFGLQHVFVKWLKDNIQINDHTINKIRNS